MTIVGLMKSFVFLNNQKLTLKPMGGYMKTQVVLATLQQTHPREDPRL
jgi:hypothetical protein